MNQGEHNGFSECGWFVCLSVGIGTQANPVNPVILSKNLYSYDALGEAVVTARDIDLDGQIDFAGPDVVSSNATAYVELASAWWRESRQYAFPDAGSSEPLLVSTSRQRLSGLGGAYSADGASGVLVAESVSIDGRGNPSTSRTVVDRAAATVYQIDQAPDSTIAALSVTVNGLLQSRRSNHNLTTTYDYDALGRMVSMQDARGGVYSRGYDEHGRVVWESDPATNGTWYAYDALGRQVAVTNALGHVIQTAYDAEDRVVATWGATYPVAYEYDFIGRMAAMYTYRGSEEIATQSQITNLKSQMDRTRWLYEDATGVLTNKVYADGKGTAYSYTSDGKLASRTWARGITTTYAYDAAGQLTGVVYSDTTPDVAYTYDRLGRQKVAQTFLSAHHYAYDPATLAMVSETIIDLQAGTSNVITRATDALGRSTGFSVAGVGDPGQPYLVTYGYDAYGRFAAVTSHSPLATSDFSFTYSYLTGSSLVSGMTASTGHAWTRSYEPQRNLISAVENTYGETVISRFDYANDEIGRRVSRADSGIAFDNPAFDKYSYNERSEVIGAQRYHGTDVSDTSQPYGGREFGYAYDPIGNRTTATETIGGETLTKTYVANALNQYTAIANPDAVGLRGSATNTATVTVNGDAVSRDSIASDTVPWHYALLADNADGPDYTFANIMAVVNPPGTNTPDVVESTSGSVYAPPRAEALTYDDDGNLLNDGRFNYTWNGENRLIKAEEQICPTNRTLRKVEYAYDHQGRMVWKVVSRRATEAQSWEEEKSIAYLWDAFNIIAETSVADSVTNTTYNVWGLDVDGTMQGAGGVGGLLAVVKDSATYIPAYDANGNIMEYVASDGTIAAHREYDPFGGTVVYTCQSAITNHQSAISFTHWFSTKPWCTVTGLSEYQYRKYSPVMGRWLSRDPIGERGGINNYCSMLNNSQSVIDVFGLRCRVDIVYGHSYDIDSKKLQELLKQYSDKEILNNMALFKQVIIPAFGWSKFEELFRRADDCDRLTAITCFSRLLLEVIYEIGLEEFNNDDDKLFDWLLRLSIVDPNLTTGNSSLGGDIPGGTKRLQDAFVNAVKYADESLKELCDGECCCETVAITYHIDPTWFDNWKNIVRKDKEHNRYFINDNITGRYRYDAETRLKSMTFIFNCKQRSGEYVGEMSDEEINEWTK